MLPPFACRLAVAILLAALTIPRMVQRGMFGDGLVYATIARNLSIGSGSFWAPRYTDTAWGEFYEHPPLGLALQAVAFGLLGDHLIVERAFSLIVLVLHAVVIASIWRRVQPAALDWLPLLFWIVPSIVTWGAVNNMLENTQALFTSTAILLFLTAMRAPDRVTPATAAAAGTRAMTPASVTIGRVMRSAGAGLAVVAAVLTKGPVGFFPLAAPLMFRLFRPFPERAVGGGSETGAWGRRPHKIDGPLLGGGGQWGDGDQRGNGVPRRRGLRPRAGRLSAIASQPDDVRRHAPGAGAAGHV